METCSSSTSTSLRAQSLNSSFLASSDSEERKEFRLQFYNLIRDIVSKLIHHKSHLILLGDLNTASGVLDSAYLENDFVTNGFVDRFRAMSEWLDGLLLPTSYVSLVQIPDREGGLGLVDAFRVIHPTVRKAFTCFNTLLGARETNFGTRIDYILCDSSLKESIEDCTILSEMKGSDHLPVVAGCEFHHDGDRRHQHRTGVQRTESPRNPKDRR